MRIENLSKLSNGTILMTFSDP